MARALDGAAPHPLLAPDIQEAILEGRQAKGMQLKELTRAMPGKWGGQGKRLAIGYSEEG